METETIEKKTEETGLTKILADSKLELTEAEQIKQSYLPYFEQMAVIKDEAQKINFVNPTQTDELIARNLRLRTVKIRTGSETVKDERKRIHMLKANVEQSAWNLIRSTCALDEERFLQVEKKREIEEKKRREQLKIDRAASLEPFGIDTQFYDLGNMPDDVWASLLENSKIAFEQKKEIERLAENLRIENERKDKIGLERSLKIAPFFQFISEEHNYREMSDVEFDTIYSKVLEEKAGYEKKQSEIRIENERLKKEADEKEKTSAKEKAKAESERKAQEAKAAKERKEIEAKAEAEKALAELRLKEERKAKEKAEAELKAKQDAEAKAKKEAEEKAELELSKGDKSKLNDFISDLESLTTKYKFKSKKYTTAYKVSVEYLQKLINNLKK